ncbi:MAG TPA: CGNR zinc finger domain-containing protein [Rhabdaerophilum sp.]|nr:CGNR zinc finger domain-containing protein [Rhabdaerophilum sp.]
MEVNIDRSTEEVGPSAGRLSLLAGRLSLDFANTLSGAGTRFEIDHLTDIGAIEAWLRHAGLMKGARSAASGAGKAALEAALDLRGVINRIGTALVGQKEPASNDLAALHKSAALGLPVLDLARDTTGHYVWREPAPPSHEALLARLALDAVDVLRFDDLSRLRRCPGEDCGWLFLDTSKNGKRRWCDMTVCGNRAKARRHRAKFTCTTVP